MNQNHPILLVDDSEDDVFFMRRALKDAAINSPLLVASNGQQAVEYLSGTNEFSDRTRFPMPSLVFLDLKLPIKNGLDVLRWLREQDSLCRVVVVVLTSSQEPEDLRQAYCLGANSYLLKPATAGRLVELVKAVKAYWLEFNLFDSASENSSNP